MLNCLTIRVTTSTIKGWANIHTDMGAERPFEDCQPTVLELVRMSQSYGLQVMFKPTIVDNNIYYGDIVITKHQMRSHTTILSLTNGILGSYNFDPKTGEVCPRIQTR